MQQQEWRKCPEYLQPTSPLLKEIPREYRQRQVFEYRQKYARAPLAFLTVHERQNQWDLLTLQINRRSTAGYQINTLHHRLMELKPNCFQITDVTKLIISNEHEDVCIKLSMNHKQRGECWMAQVVIPIYYKYKPLNDLDYSLDAWKTNK